METKLELLGLSNPMGNIHKAANGEISEEKYHSKHTFFSVTSNWLLNAMTMKIRGVSLPNWSKLK